MGFKVSAEKLEAEVERQPKGDEIGTVVITFL